MTLTNDAVSFGCSKGQVSLTLCGSVAALVVMIPAGAIATKTTTDTHRVKSWKSAVFLMTFFLQHGGIFLQQLIMTRSNNWL